MFDSSILSKNVGPEIVMRNVSGSLYVGNVKTRKDVIDGVRGLVNLVFSGY